jgi:hypothetical protein
MSDTQERPVSQLAEALVDLEEELRLESQTAWGTREEAIALRKRTQGLLLEAADALQASEEREQRLCEERIYGEWSGYLRSLARRVGRDAMSGSGNSVAWNDYAHRHSYSTPCHEAKVVGEQNHAQTYTECTFQGCDAVLVRCSCGNEYWV